MKRMRAKTPQPVGKASKAKARPAADGAASAALEEPDKDGDLAEHSA